MAVAAIEKKTNMLVTAINSLMEKFLPAESKHFDIEAFARKMQSENQWPLEEGLSTDYEVERDALENRSDSRPSPGPLLPRRQVHRPVPLPRRVLPRPSARLAAQMRRTPL
jgi:hypothetical protein